MKSLARAIVAGSPQAVTALLGFTLLAVLIPFLPIGVIASGAAVVLLCLYHAPTKAGSIVALTSAAVLVLSIFAFRSIWFAILFCALIWVIPLLLGNVLKSTQSLSFCIQIVSITGLLILVVVKLAVPNIDELWHELLQQYIAILSQHTEIDEKTKEIIIQRVPYGFTAQLLASIMLMEVIIVLVGYWWYSLLIAQVSFKESFNQLKLGKFLGTIALILAVAALALSVLQVEMRWIKELALVSLSLFVLQGLAIIHFIVEHMLKSRLWLIVAYAALILVPFFGTAVTLTGVIDNFIPFRRIIKNS